MGIVYAVFVLLAVIALQALLLRRYGLRRLSYSRAFSKKAAFAGDTVEMVEVIRNAKWLPVPWLRAESRMSPSLRFDGAVAGNPSEAVPDGEEDGLHEMNEDSMYHRSVFYLAPFSQVTRLSRLRLLSRGHYEVGSVALTAGDLFGFAQAAKQMDTGASIDVYPRLLADGELDIPSTRWQGDLAVRRWIMPDPFLVAGIRRWQPGDARRDVHWAATARTGRLQVKAHDHTADPKLLVVLNVQMREGQWGDLMEYERSVIEQGISLAATLCLKALAAGVEAGFAANAPLAAGISGESPSRRNLCDAAPLPSGRTTWLPPARYAGRDTDLLEALARLRVLRTRNFHTFLGELGQISGQDILILSAYDSARIQAAMATLRLGGNLVALLPLGKEVAV